MSASCCGDVVADATLAPPEERGTLDVRTAVVEHTVRRLVLDLDESVQRRRVVSLPPGVVYPRVSVSIHGTWARVQVDVAATWPVAVSDLAERVRAHVLERTTPLTGVDVRSADVTVHVVRHDSTDNERRRVE